MAQQNKKTNTNAPLDTSFGYLGSLYQRYIRNQKKITALVITGALTMSLVTGCSKATTDSSASGSSTTATTSDADSTSDGSVSTVSFTKSDMFTDRDSDPSYDEKSASTITFSESGVSSSSDSVTISDSSTTSNDAADSDTNDTTDSSCTTVTISEAGTYILTGSASNAQVIIDADKETKIQLVLDDLTLSCKSSAPIYVRKADKVFITLADGSSNTLSTTGEFVAIDDNNIDAVIFSKDDLTLNGSGSLTINSPYGHGIVSKDDLVVTSGTYTMTCAKHGLSGKDSVRILDGTFDLTVTKDGIHASNDDDENLGYIYIAGGTFTINSDDDGMHADSTLYIEDGTIDIQKSYEGLEGQTITILDGDIDIVSSDDGINAANGSGSNDSINDKQEKGDPSNGQMPGNPPSGDSFDPSKNTNENNSSNSDDSQTDNKPQGTPPSNGNFDPSNNSNNNTDQNNTTDTNDNSTDNNVVTMSTNAVASETETSTTSDDAASSENTQSSDNKQMPGNPPSGDNQMPGNPPSNSNFDPSDNSNNNSEQPQGNAPGGMGGFDMDADESCVLTINGGTITINAGGDGIDSNGYFYMNGGTVYVEGPESNGDSALDYSISATITGGYFLSTGYSGMAQNFGSDSTQCSYMLTLSSNTSGTTTVTLTDADGNVLLSHETSKSYNSVIVSCPELEVGSTYTLTTGDTSQSITPTSTVN